MNTFLTHAVTQNIIWCEMYVQCICHYLYKEQLSDRTKLCPREQRAILLRQKSAIHTRTHTLTLPLSPKIFKNWK